MSKQMPASYVYNFPSNNSLKLFSVAIAEDRHKLVKLKESQQLALLKHSLFSPLSLSAGYKDNSL